MRKLEPEDKTFASAIKIFLLYCKAKNLAPRTIETYRAHLQCFQKFIGNTSPEKITAGDIQAYTLSRPVSPATNNNHLRTLSVFFHHHNINIDITKAKEKRTLIVPFTTEQVRLLLKQPNKKTFAGLRDLALMNLLLDTGMRITEALNICRNDTSSTCIKITGKGNKERIVPIGQTCYKVLNEYLQAVANLPLESPVFISVYDNPFTRDQVGKRFKQYGLKAGITGVRVSPHTFRHTFAKLYLLNGGDMFTLQGILGHESLEMVRRYVHMVAGDLEAQHRKYSPLDGLINRKRTL